MVSREFLENVESGNLITVRSALLDELIIDRTFKSFDEDFKVANEKLEGLVVSFDEEPIEPNPEKWDKDYLNQQKVALMVNFSQERIAHLKDVISKVMPPDLSKDSNNISSCQTSSGGRTGSTIRNERVVGEKEKIKNEPGMACNPTPSRTNPTSRTGKKVINETIYDREKSRKKKSETEGVSTAMIIGGATVAAVGFMATEPILIGTGAVVAGVGACAKISTRR